MAATDFWHYSLAHYALPEVADTCLTLQDDYGLDVNLVLFCLWYGQFHGEFTPSQLQRLLAFSTVWSGQVVRPLREIRRWLKTHTPDPGLLPSQTEQLQKLRSKVKSLELESEQLQQHQLQLLMEEATAVSVSRESAETTAPPKDRKTPGRSSMEKNLRHYLNSCFLPIEGPVAADIDDTGEVTAGKPAVADGPPGTTRDKRLQHLLETLVDTILEPRA